MKKTQLSILFFIGVTLNLIAQTNYGIKGGINYTNINFISEQEDIKNNKYKIDFHVGVFFKKNISERWNFKPELIYSRKGYTLENTSKDKVNLNYINLPIFFEYKVIKKLNIEFGPELGYLISAELKRDKATKDISEIWDNKFDAGLGLGINYDITKKINLNLRYVHGLISVQKDTQFTVFDSLNDVNTTYDIYTLNSTIQLSVNYLFK